MNRKLPYLILVLFCFITSYGIHLGRNNVLSFVDIPFLERTILLEDDCDLPTNLGVKKIESDNITIYWDKISGVSWEYIVQLSTDPFPSGGGIVSASNELKVSVDNLGNPLQSNKEYILFVRTKCGIDQFSEWESSNVFKTLCKPFTLPYLENFEVASSSKDCWNLRDNNNDGTGSSNKWQLYYNLANAYEGNYCMYFYGTNTGKNHDDYLISPTFKLDKTSMYLLTYYYRTHASTNTEFEVLLSNEGIDIENFKTVIQESAVHKTSQYIKKKIYITNQDGDVNIAWNVKSNGLTYLYIDKVSLEKVDCVSPENEEVKIDDITKNQGVFSWTDLNNKNWEYYVQEAWAAPPVGSGNIVSTTTATVTKVSSTGASLQPDTEYEFWIRSSCGLGKNSEWVGPLFFRTLCDVLPVPFKEGFNKNSTTIQCWTIIDENKDKNNTYNLWNVSNSNPQEGDQMMQFAGLGTTKELPHNDWLISPSFSADPTKYYRVKYHSKGASSSDVDYKVWLSTKGRKIKDFEKVVRDAQILKSAIWKEDKIIIGNLSGEFNLGWQVTSKVGNTQLNIDNVLVDELDCPEPFDLGVKDIKEENATIFWTDHYGVEWEYAVQEAKLGTPVGGTTTKSKEIVIANLTNGKPLEHSTEYEFFVRTICANASSDWFGPIPFKTSCGIYSIPFKEGFNNGSKSFFCWTIEDDNKDATSPTGNNIWKQSTLAYEGSHAMLFQGLQNNKTVLPHNDFLISPALQLESGKVYRLRYNFKTLPTVTNDYEFEVLLAKNNQELSSFKEVIVPRKKYDPNQNWEEEYLFFSGVKETVYLAWHVTSATSSTYLLLDNVRIEEVLNCQEPIGLDVKDIGSYDAVINWKESADKGDYEYYLQNEGLGMPTLKGNLVSTNSVNVSIDSKGNKLIPNTTYEFYVRTVCGNGSYSIWNGPFKFTTLCVSFDVPFFEGFNVKESTYRCWTILDVNNDENLTNNMWKVINSSPQVYEGDQSMYFYGTSGKTHNDWLISPTIKMTNSLYMLRYRYKTNSLFNNVFSVNLSNSGTKDSDFTKNILSSKTYKNNDYLEEVVYFTGTLGDAYLGWHVESIGTTHLYLDKISLKEIVSCPEPYHIKVSEQSKNSLKVKWEQYGPSNEWEVWVMKLGEGPTAVPLQTITVKTTPELTINGLTEGTAYSIYIRTKCEGSEDFSEWSELLDVATKVGANDECAGALNIPINISNKVDKYVAASMSGATSSAISKPSCYSTLKNDVWFEFTATDEKLVLNALNLKSATSNSATIMCVLYDQNCTTITANSIDCFPLTSGETLSYKVLDNLVPGTKYYLRVGLAPFNNDETIFYGLGLTKVNSVYVSESGKDYSLERLVKEVLVNTSCDVISNVKYQNGDGSVGAQSINTIGYFNKNNSIFPFEQGIVLSTGEVEYVEGPYTSEGKGKNNFRWVGDKDLNDAIADAGGMPSSPKVAKDMRVSQLSFDLVSIKDSIKFDYLFASNSYTHDCDYSCENGALFAAWLVDTVTGKGQNLAKINGTDIPVSLSTILDTKKTGGKCESVNPQFYWNQYVNNQINPIEAPFNFAGSTIAMSTETVAVIPGRKYYIKLAVMDFCTNVNHTSAVFFNGGSFDLGNLDLGPDLLVETNTALCAGNTTILESGIVLSDELNVDIEWYKDGVLIPGASKPDIEIDETGQYVIKVKFLDLDCETSGSINVEMFPLISSVVNQAEEIVICNQSLNEIVADLTTVEKGMFADVDRSRFSVGYYENVDDAKIVENGIDDVEAYSFGKNPEIKELYIRVENIITGCYEVFTLPISLSQGEIPVKPVDVVVCAEYSFPALETGQFYYSEARGNGVKYDVGDVLRTHGEHIIYKLQVNNEEGCYEEVSFKVNITSPVVADVFEDEILKCDYYTLKPLSEFNKYFTEPNGKGYELTPGTKILFAQKIYVYAVSSDGVCIDESSFSIEYDECPIMKGISPNGDGVNDRFDLSFHGVQDLKIYNRYGVEVYSHGLGYSNEWFGQSNSGGGLPDGTYYYVIITHNKVRTGWVYINR